MDIGVEFKELNAGCGVLAVAAVLLTGDGENSWFHTLLILS